MLNRITLQGRLTKDPEIRSTQNQTIFCNFMVACDRNFSGQDGQKQTDFLPCVAWKQKAQFLGQYFHRGDMILLSGMLTSRQYDDQNGQRKTVYEILVDEINFCGSKTQGQGQAQPQPPMQAQGEPLPEDDFLPFDV